MKIVENENFYKQWFQQDGAKPHTADYSLINLAEFFENRIISDRLEYFWPPSSPDLNECDCSLLPNPKSIIYKSITKYDKNCLSLKAAIIDSFKNLSIDFCKNSINSFKKRLILCKAANGQHFENKL